MDSDPDGTVDALIRASRILSDVFKDEGYSRAANQQAFKLFEEIEFCFSRQNYIQSYQNEGLELFNFVFAHIFEIGHLFSTNNIDEMFKKFSVLNLPNNPFKGSILNRENSDLYIGEERDADFSGLISVRITNRTKDSATYLFSRDAYNQDYFLHFDNFRDGGWREWCQLAIGQKVRIVADESRSDGKAVNAKEIYLDY